jgi:Big-like domain-containing protein
VVKCLLHYGHVVLLSLDRGIVLGGAASDPKEDVSAASVLRKIALAAVAALVLAPGALAGPGLRVGVVDDAPIWNDAGSQIDLARNAGFDSIRMTAQWTPGQTAMPRGQLSRLQRAAMIASMRGVNPIVSIYNAGGAGTPTTPDSRAQFVEFAKNVVRSLPWVTTFIVGNEPNTSLYWQPQFDGAGGDAAAAAYFQLLAASYDAIKSVRPNVTIIGGALDPHGSDDPTSSRQTHSPTAFIRDLGLAYRASGRTTPIMDVWDEHVYADTSALPPSMPHTSTTIAEGDYTKLVAALGKAFDGTGQRGSTLPIFYGEYGVETAIPAAKAGVYTGAETSKTVDEATQAAYYAEAFRLALCQPNVIGIMIFHTVDEQALGAWQSGTYYADGTPKSSLPAIRDAANAARAGTAATCPDHTAPTVGISTVGGVVTATATDDIGVGKVSLYVNGALVDTKYAGPYTFDWEPAKMGRYNLDVRAVDAAGNLGRFRTAIEAKPAKRSDATTTARWVFSAARPQFAVVRPHVKRRPRG